MRSDASSKDWRVETFVSVVNDGFPLLMKHFIAAFNDNHPECEVEGIEQEAREAILKHSWPGDVRELSNTIGGSFTFRNNQRV